jgi:hypothetical protein
LGADCRLAGRRMSSQSDKAGRAERSDRAYVLKATVANPEVRQPAGKWEKVAGQNYTNITHDPEGGPHMAWASREYQASRCSCKKIAMRWYLVG